MTAVARLKDKTHSETIFTVEWLPGTDKLLGICHCDARKESEDPIELWDWLLGHPEGHTNGTCTPAQTPVEGVSPEFALTR